MKTETIPNQYDGPHAPSKRLSDTHFSLDFANSDDAVKIDSGIRETIKGVNKKDPARVAVNRSRFGNNRRANPNPD